MFPIYYSCDYTNYYPIYWEHITMKRCFPLIRIRAGDSTWAGDSEQPVKALELMQVACCVGWRFDVHSC